MDKYKLGFISFSKKSKFWIYTINNVQWNILKKHLSFSEKTYLPTFKYEQISKNDVIIIYVKSYGFTCTSISEKIISKYDINSNEIPYIFEDKSIGKFNIELKVINFFIKPIIISNVYHYFSEHKEYKSKGSFIRKYCDGEFLYKLIEFDFGKLILEGLESISRIEKNQWLKDEEEKEINKQQQKKKKNEKIEKKEKICLKAIRKNNTNQYSTCNISESSTLSDEFDIISFNNNCNCDCDCDCDCDNECQSNPSESIGIEDINQDNIIPMIPILFDPCDEFRWYEECSNDNDFIEEFKAHYQRCNECEINDNNNHSLIPYLNRSNITFEIACFEDEGFDIIFKAYQISSEKIIEEDITKNLIRLYIIQEQDNIYNNSILIEWGVKMSTFTKAEILTGKKN
jgi:hypothetical protein